jgi:hypothetical protein
MKRVNEAEPDGGFVVKLLVYTAVLLLLTALSLGMAKGLLITGLVLAASMALRVLATAVLRK